MVKERVNMTIEKEIIDLYRKYCKDNGMFVSGKVELFMRKELEELKIIPKPHNKKIPTSKSSKQKKGNPGEIGKKYY